MQIKWINIVRNILLTIINFKYLLIILLHQYPQLNGGFKVVF